jgi:5' nucleotidase family
MQGKILMLITNSDFAYTDKMMSYAYDEYLPEGKTWRDLFDMVQLCVTPSSGCHCMWPAGVFCH